MISPSDIDLFDPDNVVQARWEIDRCETDAQFATWARKWGRSVFASLDEMQADLDSASAQGFDI